MSVFRPRSAHCSCGKSFTVQIARSVNATRQPVVRQAIVDGTFHRFVCPSCGRPGVVDKEFSYVDFSRNFFCRVRPRGERHRWRDASAELERDMRKVPEELAPQGRTLRVTFGLDELREKLVAQDAQLDDRVVELLKALLVYEHPFLLRRSRLRLVLDRVETDRVEFTAGFEHSPGRYRLGIPRSIVEDLVSRKNELEKWVNTRHRRSSIFALRRDHWVNMWRWSPQPSALDTLRSVAETIRKGGDVKTQSKSFRQMLESLPRGSHLPSWAKEDLRTLFTYAKKKGPKKLQDTLFEIRFGIELEDDWAYNTDPNDIDTLWKLLKDLPDTNVEGNTFIKEIRLDTDGGGVYDPQDDSIGIGEDELGQPERFQDVVRHEVGHGVHEKFDKIVTPWLGTRFGWQRFSTSAAQIDQWVGLMGGWGPLTSNQRSQVRTYLAQALGPGESWDPGSAPKAPAGHPWSSPTFGPRLAYERSGSDWWKHNAQWHRANGKAFFLNFWYAELMCVDAATLDLVNKGMPDKYAAMSPWEFFAELYALYYELDDPQHGNVPADVAKWLGKNIGAASVNQPSKPSSYAPARRLAAEQTRRPRGR